MKSNSLPGQSSNDRSRSLPSLSLSEADTHRTYIDEDYSATSADSSFSHQRPVTPASLESAGSSVSWSDSGHLHGRTSIFRHRSLSATAKTLGRRLSKLRTRNASFSGISHHSALPSVSEVFTECKVRPTATAHVTIEEISDMCPGDFEGDAIVLLVGGTGTGKSNFIAKLASGQADGNKAKISESELHFGTSGVKAYRMKHRHANLWTSKDIILVDTPGLSHHRNTEWWVLSQIKEWMENNDVARVDRLLYFDRISDNRMRRSRGRSSDIFKSICGKDAANRALVITTMWDDMWNDRLKCHAQQRYNDLMLTYWKDFVYQGCRIEKFENTFATALGALQQFSSALDPRTTRSFVLEKEFRYESLRETEAGGIAFQALQERLENLIADQQTVWDDLRLAERTQNSALSDILQKQIGIINSDINQLMGQLQAYSPRYTGLRDEVLHQFDRPDSRASSLGGGINGKSRLRHRIQDWLLRLRSINIPKGIRSPRKSSERIYASHDYSQSVGALPCLIEHPD